MISKTWSRKSIAAVVAVAILSVYSMVVLASPAAKAPSGELSISGHVTVNGENAISGGTLFSDSILNTAEKSAATVSLSKMGRVELMPSSNLKLSFNEQSLSGLLDSGSMRVSTLPGIAVNFTTKDGVVVVDGTQATSFTVSIVEGVTTLSTHSGVAVLRVADSVKTVAAGEYATAGMPDSKTDPGDDDDRLSDGELAALIIAAAGASAAIFWAAFHDNDVNFGGNPIVISPAK